MVPRIIISKRYLCFVLGNTALHRVALIGNYEAVATLCKKAPDIVNKLNNILLFLINAVVSLTMIQNGMSALHYAVNAHCVNVILWWGGHINGRTNSGYAVNYI